MFFVPRKGWKRHPFICCRFGAADKRYSGQPDQNEGMERERSERVMTE